MRILKDVKTNNNNNSIAQNQIKLVKKHWLKAHLILKKFEFEATQKFMGFMLRIFVLPQPKAQLISLVRKHFLKSLSNALL